MTTSEYRPWNDETLHTFVAGNNWRGVLDYCAGKNGNTYVARVWALAMTVYYGPVGIHESRLDAHGRPDLTKCDDCPQVERSMIEAMRELRRLLGLEVL